MNIRRMTFDDLDAVHEIGRACPAFFVSESGEQFWSKGTLSRWCASRHDLILIAEEGAELIGFALFACHRPTGKAVLENLWVAPGWRRRNVAARLLESAFTKLKRRKYLVTVANVNVQNKQARIAFRSMGFRRGYAFDWMDRFL
jgi:ribosomal protein S18 acetylase RimI-like enzyme